MPDSRAEKVMEQMPETAAAKHFEEYREFTAAIRQSGHFVGCNRLLPPKAATTVRVRNGKVSTTDGPYAETKEQLGGYYVIEARDLDEAIGVAAKIPGAIAADEQTLRALGFQRDRKGDMKYLCLVYMAEHTLADVPDSECLAYGESLRESGRYVAAEALQRVATATTVRVRNGKVSLTDGPFAETKEQLAGFYLIDAKDLDDAIAMAAKIPPARVGSIEVRAVRELSAK